MATSELIIKQGEAKTIQLNVTNADKTAADLTGATLFLGVKKTKTDTDYIFTKVDADFNKTQAAQGIISVALTETDTNQTPGLYVGELQCSWEGPPEVVDKSLDIKMTIQKSVIPVTP